MSAPLTLRPGRVYRAGAWGTVAFAVVFGFAGIVQDGTGAFDWEAAIPMEIFAVLMLAFGLSIITAQAVVTGSGIHYRYGVVRRAVPAAEIESVTVGAGSGAFYPRICLHVRQRGRERSIRLAALQRPNTAKGRAALEEAEADVRAALGT